MTTLKYDNNIRNETDENTIATLIRKGWVDITPPPYDSNTEKLIYNSSTNTYIIESLTKEELSAMADAQAANDLAALKESQRNAIYDQINAGFLVEPEGFRLALADYDRSLFTQMLSLVKEALDLGLITNSSPQIIGDINNQKQTISTLRFREIMVKYGMYYKSLWDQF